MRKESLLRWQWWQAAIFTLISIGLASCVTINIYFPAAAAEKAADKVIDEIWQAPSTDHPSTPAVNQEQKP